MKSDRARVFYTYVLSYITIVLFYAFITNWHAAISSDYAFQKQELLNRQLSSWHPIGLAYLQALAIFIDKSNADIIVYVFQIMSFIGAFYLIIYLFNKSYSPKISLLSLNTFLVCCYPAWFFLETAWKDAFFTAVYLAGCSLFAFSNVGLNQDPRSRNQINALIFALMVLGALFRHNANASFFLVAIFAILFNSKQSLSNKMKQFFTICIAVLMASLAVSFLTKISTVRKDISMTNFVLTYDIYGSLSKASPDQRDSLIQSLKRKDYPVKSRGISGYRHTAPSDYLFWGAEPSVQIENALSRDRLDNIGALYLIITECPLCYVDFKIDSLLQTFGISRYDFDWDGLNRVRESPPSTIRSTLQYISDSVQASEAQITRIPSLLAYPITFFGAFSIASAVLIGVCFTSSNRDTTLTVLFWITAGWIAILPYLFITPGSFFRYSAPSLFCFYTGSFLGVCFILSSVKNWIHGLKNLSRSAGS